MTAKIIINNTTINIESPNGITDAAFLEFVQSVYIAHHLHIRNLESKNYGSVIFPDGKAYTIKLKTEVIFEENN